jgi:tripartite-type tricarboxylate transporter receptor subunit TctC
MPHIHRRDFLLGAAAGSAALSLGAPSLLAADYPTQGVKFVVPFSAGSMTDILARAVADKLQTRWKQTVIVENRAGVPGTSSVAKGPTDGYTLLFTSNGHVVLGAVNKNLPFDPIGDFAAVTKVASTPAILIVPGDGPHKTVADLVAAAKAKPGELSYASAGVGSSTGIAAELFKKVTGTQVAMVAHRGLPESNTSVLRGDTAMGFTFYSVGGDLIQTGKLRALAVSGDTRLAQLPNVPTFTEAGFADFAYDPWFGFLAPAAVPKAIVDQVAKDVAQEIGAADLKERLAPQGVTFGAQAPDAFAASIRDDAARFRPLVQAASGAQ